MFHCPYCYGYELDGRPIGVLAAAPIAIHHAPMLPDWGPTTFFINGMFEPDAEQLTSLERHRGTLERECVISIGGQADVALACGRVIELEGLFTQPPTRLANPLAALLGCEFEPGPMGEFIKVDATREPAYAVSLPVGTRQWLRAMWRSRWAMARAGAARRTIR